eukprot:CAMPEP_0119341630 /NCGR_PEP_ID=MMETSP1333-20130426/102874_1 /TAXON_ID=418940 /ORGANISM="Scyphosphaera apsteinii, Strain RCC1455" /LENGTH=306 /DNA_ID=CAMNT_0007353657 /DNA_START=46 /DNA_END=966 /DNA_ORIENTATION=+
MAFGMLFWYVDGLFLPVSLRQAAISLRVAVPAALSPLSAVDVNTEKKLKILQLAAALDRGQSFNPTSSDAYSERMSIMETWLRELIAASPPLPTTLGELEGEWELIFTSVRHGIFRSSPFFLAIQEAYMRAGEPEKAELFFKLHELQTCSWGVSKIGRVAQIINATEEMLYSEFDTNLFSLTTIPIIGFFKLLPTFGGCVVTASSAELAQDGTLNMEVKYTTSRPVPGLSGLRPLPGEVGRRIAQAIWTLRVPVGAVWKLLPWNKGVAPRCSTKLVYFDGDFRIVEDGGGELFVYTRAVAPRAMYV